jgi:hypothetical protein
MKAEGRRQKAEVERWKAEVGRWKAEVAQMEEGVSLKAGRMRVALALLVSAFSLLPSAFAVVHQHAMGFMNAKHTFRLFEDGGAIEVRALDEKELPMIRYHLQLITERFGQGDFQDPMAVHDRLPDGAAKMGELRRYINYNYSDIENGGRVRIRTSNPEALKAVHEFLRFQIREHETGDTKEITKESFAGRSWRFAVNCGPVNFPLFC